MNRSPLAGFQPLGDSKEKVVLEIQADEKTDSITLGTNGSFFQRTGLPVELLPMKIDGDAEATARFIDHH